MDDARIYRWTGLAGLSSIGLFLIEFPIYFLRGPMPSLTGATLLYIGMNIFVPMLYPGYSVASQKTLFLASHPTPEQALETEKRFIDSRGHA